jgi:quercetin dioxygenase-like cupin family protein
MTEYFGTTGDGTPTAGGSFVASADARRLQLGPGLVARPLVGAGCMLTYVEWDEGCHAPEHAHAEEQLLLVVDGEIELELDGEARVLRPGDAAVIPPWVTHAARGLAARSVTVEAFAPPRAALLALLAQG